ncbi:DUF3667 domain-containing protein [Polaribacter haliotis]|uniref:DUF3667 domain-containing protein n=1 Tax=Polaribacter haliotis TaxID=1888915 RepID=A0A7L8AET4_9FLAO|nr:DUF3667 domain-containing protein [Polaribacter haliotis]QOD60434.1 DUF3667 domain-containing protein [Polaribacter haliotis]
MNCKNCQDSLEENAQFCDNCGAKVVTYRITFKHLISELVKEVFGVDSKFFLTLRKMVTNPEEVIGEYISGVRKKYVNPFAFLAIAAALSLVIYNYFADDFIAIHGSYNSERMIEVKKAADIDLSSLKGISKEEMATIKIEKQSAQFQIKLLDNMMQFMLRYFNLLTFLFLPLYALLSKWTYRKPHNFGEHIVINAYIYGFATYFTIIAFFAAMLIHPSIYMYSMFAYIAYYLYATSKLYSHSFGKALLKLLRFIIGLVLLTIVFVILSIIIGFFLKQFAII